MKPRHRLAWALAACLSLTSCGGGGGSPDGGGGGGGSVADPTGRVAGQVVDDTGEPVVGAAVAIDGNVAQSDAAGEFAISNVSPGNRVIRTTRAGYSFPEATVTVVAGATATMQVHGTRVSGLPTISVEATPRTLPFSGGTVTLVAMVSDPEGDPLVVRGVYDLGTYEMTAVSAGQYQATIMLPSNSTNIERTFTFTASASDRINLVSATTTVTVRGLMTPAAPDNSQPVDGGAGGPSIPNI